MSYIKLIAISFVGFFVLISVLGLIFPSTVVVSRAIDIKSPKDSIYLLIKDLNGWRKWMDGIDSTRNFKNPLKEQLGNYFVTIQLSKTGDTAINALWKSKNNGQQESVFEIFQQKNQTSAIVHWQFVQHINWYPWERFASMMNDKILGTMMERNLKNLKESIESN